VEEDLPRGRVPITPLDKGTIPTPRTSTTTPTPKPEQKSTDFLFSTEKKQDSAGTKGQKQSGFASGGKKQGSGKRARSDGSQNTGDGEKSIKIAPLTFPKVHVGMLSLCIVKEIRQTQLHVSLPNNLTAFVGLDEVSTHACG
jgi:hypothetical protein